MLREKPHISLEDLESLLLLLGLTLLYGETIDPPKTEVNAFGTAQITMSNNNSRSLCPISRHHYVGDTISGESN